MSSTTPASPPSAQPLAPDPDNDPEQPSPAAQGISTNWRVFIGSALGVLAVSLWALLSPASAQGALQAVVSWVSSTFGWFYILTATVVLVFILVIACSRQGSIRLGPDHSRPQFSLFSWTAMLFAAGIGVDLMYFSVLEPVTQYFTPPQGRGESAAAARQALVWTLFHYGITGWAMYSLMGMAFGYFAYRFNLRLSIRAALYPIIGRRIHGAAGDAVDVAAMLGTVFGVATSLGIGVVQINYGLQFLFGVPQSTAVQSALIVVSVGIAILSATSGVDKGIRLLSEINVYLAVGLMLYVLVMDRTDFLLNGLVTNLGDYASRFAGMTLDAMPFDHPDDWMASWTLFFWAWWVAWCPFVGLFLARISRGRTIRQFVFGTLSIPFLFILLWVSVFGNAALGRIFTGDTQFSHAVMSNQEAAFYTLLSQYPGATAAIAVATFTGLLFYVTSADSGALIMANFSSRIEDPSQDGPKWMRVFWAVLTGLVTLAMLQIGGVATLQAATVVFGLPFAVVLYLIMLGLWKALRLERNQLESADAARAGILAANRHGGQGPQGAARTWRQRLVRTVSLPGRRAVQKYVAEVVRPALEEVAQALTAAGVQTVVETGTDSVTGLEHVCLTEQMPGEQNFIYQVYPVAQPAPGYLLAPGQQAQECFRLETFGRTGSRGYDVYGFTQEQLIHDVLDHHEHHLEWIRLSTAQPETSSTQVIGDSEATKDWGQDFAEAPSGTGVLSQDSENPDTTEGKTP